MVHNDIVNAFNTLPWEKINKALAHHGVPRYLRRLKVQDGAEQHRCVHVAPYITWKVIKELKM